MDYFCCTNSRRNAVKKHSVLNGIDFLEVLDIESDPFEERQTTLFVHFLKPVPAAFLDVENFKIDGGERIHGIKILSVVPQAIASFPSSPPTDADKVLVLKVDKAGDFSNYLLRLIGDSGDASAPKDFDPVLSKVTFSFKVSCAKDFDCEPVHVCDAPPSDLPEISYLAKDFASFRQLMLDRMSLLMPQWTERNPADLGITIVELLAYIADYLSYKQDAIATEAYLATARKRVSIRRHARLVDYFMHDGCNSRTWIHVQVGPNANGIQLTAGEWENSTKIIATSTAFSTAMRIDSEEFEKAIAEGSIVYELMHDITLFTAHNEIEFYTWGDKNCCLPKGATQATLKGSYPNLKVGDVLILCEMVGPETGEEADANPGKRHAVQLTEVSTGTDVLFETEIESPPNSPPNSPPGSPPQVPGLGITEIKWHQLDALPFPLCISSDSAKGYIEKISMALGNNVLADHGQSFVDGSESSLIPPTVPGSKLEYAKPGQDFCHPGKASTISARYNPEMSNIPLTQAEPFKFEELKSAASALQRNVRITIPAIRLLQTDEEGEVSEWTPQNDLLGSAATKKEFVVEIEEDSATFIRFGDNVLGSQPPAASVFKTKYRIGNGTSGNIGAGVLTHLVTNDATVIAHMPDGIAAVWNPFPSGGGKEAETKEEVRQYAPEAFRTQERAVTALDYENFAQICNGDIQRAAATFRWTGSWKTVFLTVDRFGGIAVDEAFEKEVRQCLERYRMAGFDLEVEDPLLISLEIEMEVCSKPSYLASDVRTALLNVFSAQQQNNGNKGVFHPDNFSFGESVYLSQLYAGAQAVDGVESVQITKFQRQGQDDLSGLENGKLTFGRREIARCDNDPNFPEHGIFQLHVSGGRT